MEGSAILRKIMALSHDKQIVYLNEQEFWRLLNDNQEDEEYGYELLRNLEGC